MLTESLRLNFLCKNIAFVLNNKYKKHNFEQLLIGHNYAHLKNSVFLMDMSIFKSLKIVLTSVKSIDLDEMQHYLGISRIQRVKCNKDGIVHYHF